MHVGIMVTASHNPPSDNAVKVYWSSGAQVLPPHDKGIIQRVMQAGMIKRKPFAEALATVKLFIHKPKSMRLTLRMSLLKVLAVRVN